MSTDWHLGMLLGKGANGEAYEAFRRDVLTGEPDYEAAYAIKKVGLSALPSLCSSSPESHSPRRRTDFGGASEDPSTKKDPSPSYRPLTTSASPNQVFIGDEGVMAKSTKLRETQLLAMIRHPYIVQYEDSFVEDGSLFVAMEFAGAGTLERYTGRSRSLPSLQPCSHATNCSSFSLTQSRPSARSRRIHTLSSLSSFSSRLPWPTSTIGTLSTATSSLQTCSSARTGASSSAISARGKLFPRSFSQIPNPNFTAQTPIPEPQSPEPQAQNLGTQGD